MSARSLLLGLLIGAVGASGVAFAGTAPLSTGNSAESSDAADLLGTGGGGAPGRQTTSSTTSPVPTTTSAITTTTVPTTTTTTEPPPAPTTTTTTPPPPPAGPQQQVVDLVNKARADAGCKALVVDDRITAAAQKHSSDMAGRDYFSHTTPEGVEFGERMTAAGYPSPGGENIAMGQRTAAQVMQSWMNSPGHKRNILDCSFTAMGVGLDTRGMYWTQNFGR